MAENQNTLDRLLSQGMGRADIAQHIADLEATIEGLKASAARWEQAYYDALKTAPTVGEGPDLPKIARDHLRRLRNENRRLVDLCHEYFVSLSWNRRGRLSPQDKWLEEVMPSHPADYRPRTKWWRIWK